MNELFEKLEIKDWLQLNAKLQLKKNLVRRMLKEKGILPKDKQNKFDNYKYFSEAQYKLLFTELFSETGLELKFNELEYITFEGTEKQANGRAPRLEFELIDAETGFFESTVITGEALDKGDKAGYKAYTGALKYFLADTFMVATGDDAEVDSPEVKAQIKKPTNAEAKKESDDIKATPKQIEILNKVYFGENLQKLLEANGIEKIEALPMTKASELIAKLANRKQKGE